MLKAAGSLCQPATGGVKQSETLEEVQHHHYRQKSLPTKNNLLEPVPFPDRSPKVQAAIDTNTLPMMRKQFIADTGGFCYEMYRHAAQGDHRRIARAFARRFLSCEIQMILKFMKYKKIESYL